MTKMRSTSTPTKRVTKSSLVSRSSLEEELGSFFASGVVPSLSNTPDRVDDGTSSTMK